MPVFILLVGILQFVLCILVQKRKFLTQLAQRVNLRNTPELTFVLDQSIEYGINMSKKIDEVTKDLHRDDEAEKE